MEYKQARKLYENPQKLSEFFGNNQQVVKAFQFADKNHEGQLRKSGSKFILHPLAIAMNLWTKYHDETLTIASFLHDTVEDCENVTNQDVEKMFGKKVSFLVDALNKKDYTLYQYPKKKFEEKIERLIWAGMKDIRVILIKIADREDNLETLANLKDNKQVRMTFETQAIFDPLKEIVNYNDNLPIALMQKNFETFLDSKGIKSDQKSIKKFKHYLFEKTFTNFNEKLYDIVYSNASQVIWRTEGWDMYDKICESPELQDRIVITNVFSDGDTVQVNFKYKKGISDTYNNNIKLQISSFSEK